MLWSSLVVALPILLLANAEMNINVQTPDAQMYHQQSSRQNQFTYGYHVNTESQQFQHKVKGPDDVTYGCYGYVDPSYKKHLVYYVADRMGYRIIFPNRQTKIFTARVSDSLNKLDGTTKGRDYDEKVVSWNDLYLPDECFRLDEILSGSPSTVSQQVVRPAATTPSTSYVHYQPQPTQAANYGQNQPQPGLPRPTQYTVPSTSPRTVSQPPSWSRPSGVGGYSPNVYETTPQVPQGNDDYDYNGLDNGGQQQVQQPQWTGSLPDINPANINLDNYDIDLRVGNRDANSFPAQLGPLEQNRWNLTQLLARIEAVNAQVITFNVLLTGLAKNPSVFANANGNSCQQMVQLLLSQKTTPQLLYVPILIPYVEGQENVNQPSGAPASNFYQQPQQQPSRSVKG